MGRGQGSGWKNLRCDDSRRHSLASKGVKSAQKIHQFDGLHPVVDEFGHTLYWKSKPIFSPNDLAKIKRNTENNFSTENYIFIAKKINSPLLSEFESILITQDEVGYLPTEISKRRYELYKELMKQVKDYLPDMYEKINSRL